MTSDQIIEKWNGLNPRERDAWVAKDVMGWRRVARPGGGGGYIGWADADGRIVALESDCTMSSGPQDWFRPSQDMQWSSNVLGAVEGEFILYRTSPNRFVASFGYSTEGCPECGEEPFEVEAQGIADKPEEAICLAALIAKLTEVDET